MLILEEHIALAADRDRLILVHTPHLEDKLKGTKLTMDAIENRFDRVLLDVVDQDEDEESNALDALLPDVDEAAAAAIAVTYRLDLLNSADQVDDVRRGVSIAKNRILPDLDLTGSWTLDSDSDQLRALNFREERRTWQGSVQLRIDDRKTGKS